MGSSAKVYRVLSSLLFCLQCSPIDCDAAVELAQLITDIQKVIRPRKEQVPWLISYRKDTPLSRVDHVKNLLLKVFERVWVFQGQHYANGWPAGSNQLWRSTMETAARLKKTELLECDGVLTFEPDCTPLLLSWVERLEQAYAKRSQPIVGNIHDGSSEIAAHVNGNAMWPITLANDWPQVLSTPPGIAWDFYHRAFFLPLAEDTPLITQWYRRKRLTDEEWGGIRKSGILPALLHGVKDSSARALARRYLLGAPVVPVAVKPTNLRSQQATRPI